jgi:hypothetical protein
VTACGPETSVVTTNRHSKFFQIALPAAEPEERREISPMRRDDEIVCEVGILTFGFTGILDSPALTFKT